MPSVLSFHFISGGTSRCVLAVIISGIVQRRIWKGLEISMASSRSGGILGEYNSQELQRLKIPLV